MTEVAMSEVTVTEAGAVRTVTLDRPAKRNALTVGMLDALMAAFEREPAADERVTVVRATGTVFCSGLDLSERPEGGGAPAGESPIHRVLEAIRMYPLPVVAVVQGDAIAGGNELALNCDLVVASTRATFGMSLAQIGLAPTWFLAERLAEAVGPAMAREMLLLGDTIPAARLAEIGVIARVAAPHELDSVATRVIDRLAANAPLSLRAIKATLVRLGEYRGGVKHDDTDGLADAARRSDDAKEGITARLERRTARFSGR
jgi:enoyl-CoA hydratase/carnithine racemase